MPRGCYPIGMTNQCACGEAFLDPDALADHVAECDLVTAF